MENEFKEIVNRKKKFDDLSIIKDFNEGISKKDIIKNYLISSIEVLNGILKRNGEDYINANKKYHVNDRYFEDIDSEEKAYWLGFLYADGYVRMKYGRSGELKLKLSIKDKEHLELFNECLNSTYPVKTEISKVRYKDGKYIGNKDKNIDEGKVFTSISENIKVIIYNNKIVNDLMSHGCVNKKTFLIRWPETREDLQRHFLRGFFDGDGCITMRLPKGKKYHVFTMNITSNYNFIIDIKNFLEENNIIITNKIMKQKNSFHLTIRDHQGLIKFYELIYENSKIFLERKKKIFDIVYENIRSKQNI